VVKRADNESTEARVDEHKSLKYTMAERTPVKVDELRNNFKLHKSILHKNVVEFATDPRQIRIKKEVVMEFMRIIHKIVNDSNVKLGVPKIVYNEADVTIRDDIFGGFELQYDKHRLPRFSVGPSLNPYVTGQEAEEAKEYPIRVNIVYKYIPAVSSTLTGAKKDAANAKRDARTALVTTNAEPIADAIVARIKELAPVRRRITPEATTAVPNAIEAAEADYNRLTDDWSRTPAKNKALFESFGVEVVINSSRATAEVGPKQGEIKIQADHFTSPLPEGMYARFFVVRQMVDDERNSHVVGGFITNTHIVVLHQYLQANYTALEEPFRKFVETTGKTYVVHPPVPSSECSVQSCDLRIQEKGACQRWYVMLPYIIAKYIAGGKPIADQTPEEKAKTLENWTKIGDWEFVRPVYASISRNPLKCWGGIVLENKLVGVGRKTRRQRKHRSTRRR